MYTWASTVLFKKISIYHLLTKYVTSAHLDRGQEALW